IPDVDLAFTTEVAAARGEELAVSREGQGAYAPRVAGQAGQRLAGRHVPGGHRAVEDRAEQGAAVRGEGHRVDVGPLAGERLDRLAGFGVPEDNARAAGGDVPSVRGEGHRDGIDLDGEGVQGLAGGDVPDVGRARAPRDEPVALGREGDADAHAALPAQAADLPAGGGVPEEDITRHARPGGELAVGRDGDGAHAALRPPDLADLPARRRVPRADDLLPARSEEELAVRGEGDRLRHAVS